MSPETTIDAPAPETFRAVMPAEGRRPVGAPTAVRLGDLPVPEPGPGEVRLRVHASALNRADLLQMRGLYPPPPGESTVPGLEAAGVVEAVGPEVDGWRLGERAMALLAGGGHGERVVVPTGQLMAVPAGLDLVTAAALPEVALTAWTNLVREGELEAGQTVLITAAASGVGSFAVQLARELGARVLVAGRSLERLEALEPLGASDLLSLGETLPEQVRELTDGRGVDLVIELAGGVGLAHSLKALRPQGRVVLVGILAGPRAEIDLADVLRRRLELRGSVLRARPREEKARLIEEFLAFAGDRLDDGRLAPVIDRVVPFDDVADAYAALEAGGVFGKIVLEMVD